MPCGLRQAIHTGRKALLSWAWRRSSGATYVRRPFPNNILPASRISAVGRAIVNIYPQPNFNATRLNQSYLRSDNTGRYRYEQPMTRWDHIASERHRASVTLTFQDGSEYRNQNGFDPPASRESGSG